MSLTPAQLDQFHRDGYIIVPDVFSDAEMDAALAAMDQTFYGKPFAAWLDDFDAGQTTGVSDGFTTTHNHEAGRTQFPTGADALEAAVPEAAVLEAAASNPVSESGKIYVHPVSHGSTGTA